MEPFVQDSDFVLFHSDALTALRALPGESVHMALTSPPYWALRDYSAAGQLGLEDTPQLYVAALVEIFREVRRVLRTDGVAFLNIGDSYCSQPNQRVQKPGGRDDVAGWKQATNTGSLTQGSSYVPGLKPKDLIGIPWRLAFALQDDGWWLRSDIIWSKPNVMPESVTDRPTKAHEYLFLLTKSPRYFWDADAIREPHSPDGRLKTVHDHVTDNSHPNYDNVGNGNERWPNGGRNKRSVWEIATEPFREAHFATFPQALVEPCVLAGTSEKGCCRSCGAPWQRVTEGGDGTDADRKALGYDKAANMKVGVHEGGHSMIHPPGMSHDLDAKPRVTKGWEPTCQCIGELLGEHPAEGYVFAGHADPMPCTVLDPFGGSGTTALVARRLGRKSILIELNADYCEMAARRLQQLSLLA